LSRIYRLSCRATRVIRERWQHIYYKLRFTRVSRQFAIWSAHEIALLVWLEKVNRFPFGVK
jgi:hypothetical protein